MIDISHFDDETAQRILTTIARVRSANSPTPALSDLREALAADFQVVPSPPSVSAGDLARQALTLLAEDPATRLAIESMAGEEESAGQHTYADPATIGLYLAVYYALSTAIDIDRDKHGKWSFKIKVKPAGEAAVRKLVEKLIGYLPG
jgi:hypothetical protein